jgi:hypothetical protein
MRARVDTQSPMPSCSMKLSITERGLEDTTASLNPQLAAVRMASTAPGIGCTCVTALFQ